MKKELIRQWEQDMELYEGIANKYAVLDDEAYKYYMAKYHKLKIKVIRIKKELGE